MILLTRKIKKEIINKIRKHNFFDLISSSVDQDSVVIVICNLWKIYKKNNALSFFEKNDFGVWSKTDTLNIPFLSLDDAGNILRNIQEKDTEIWVNEIIYEIISHIVSKHTWEDQTVAQEYFCINEIFKHVLTDETLAQQQLLGECFEQKKYWIEQFTNLLNTHVIEQEQIKLAPFHLSLKSKMTPQVEIDLNCSLAQSVTSMFSALASDVLIDVYEIKKGIGFNYMAVLDECDTTIKDFLNAQCYELTQLKPDMKAKWCFLNLEEYRIVVGIQENISLCECLTHIYSNITLSNEELVAVHDIIEKVLLVRNS